MTSTRTPLATPPSSATPASKPLVLVPACQRMLGVGEDASPYQVVGRKYIDAVRLAGCQPLVVPWAEGAEIEHLLEVAEGLFLTGSPSNVHPSHFNEGVRDPSLPLDPQRDDWTLPMIRRALAIGLPLFAVCRGTQEMNVALGGSLHQAVHEVGPYADHREPPNRSLAQQYGPAHEVHVSPGGRLEAIVGQPRFMVNSLHGQAVNQLAPGLRVEARAPDGLIEAFSLPAAPGFNLAVQWHPEWRAAENPQSMALLRAFGRACENYRERPRTPLP